MLKKVLLLLYYSKNKVFREHVSLSLSSHFYVKYHTSFRKCVGNIAKIELYYFEKAKYEEVCELTKLNYFEKAKVRKCMQIVMGVLPSF